MRTLTPSYHLALALLLTPLNALGQAATPPAPAEAAHQPPTAVQAADEFLGWLSANEKAFAACDVQKKGKTYVLCDGTVLEQSVLKKLFALTPELLVAAIQEKGAKIELLCDVLTPQATFAAVCQTESTRAQFQKMGTLHGQYLPQEDTILIKSSASKGSLIHEYVHREQTLNQNLLFGKVYKASRNAIQKDLVAYMDQKIIEISQLEAKNKQSEIKKHLPDFMAASDALQKFSPWQDLIDERSIFRLYIKYGKEFGIAKEDLALAEKNMGSICQRPEWQGKLPKNQCK